MAAEDDAGGAELLGEFSHVVGGPLEGVVAGGFGGVGPGVAHHVWGYDAETEGGEERDLIPPSKGQVRPAVDEEDGVEDLTFGFGEDVAVCYAV